MTEDLGFDKRFAEKMRTAGAPDFSDEDWERLHTQLEDENRRHWRVLPLWWLGILSGLLLLSNIGWWWMWRQSHQSTKALTEGLQQVKRGTQMEFDTVWHHHTVYQYDTVYRTVYVQSEQKSMMASGGAAPGQMIISEQQASALNLPPGPGSSSPPVSQTESNVASLAITTNKDSIAQATELPMVPGVFDKLPSTIAFLEIQEKLPAFPAKPQPPLSKVPATPKTFILTPRAFRAGIGAGFVIPQSRYLSNSSGFIIAAGGEMAFSNQLALTLEGAYSGVNIRGTEYNEALGLPTFVPPGVDYKLKYFEIDEGTKPILQITTGMRYWLSARHRISPYLGFGYGMQWNPSYQLHAEYLDQVTGKEKETTINVPFSPSPISLLDLNVGLRYRFLGHWLWQSGIDYQLKLIATQPGIPRYWGFNSKVLYEF